MHTINMLDAKIGEEERRFKYDHESFLTTLKNLEYRLYNEAAERAENSTLEDYDPEVDAEDISAIGLAIRRLEDNRRQMYIWEVKEYFNGANRAGDVFEDMALLVWDTYCERAYLPVNSMEMFYFDPDAGLYSEVFEMGTKPKEWLVGVIPGYLDESSWKKAVISGRTWKEILKEKIPKKYRDTMTEEEAGRILDVEHIRDSYAQEEIKRVRKEGDFHIAEKFLEDWLSRYDLAVYDIGIGTRLLTEEEAEKQEKKMSAEFW